MRAEPDFYMYGGDGNQRVLGVLRACRKVGFEKRGEKQILLVAIDPPVEPGALSHDAKTDILGLTDRSQESPIHALDSLKVVGAVVWEIRSEVEEHSDEARSIGIGALYNSKPLILENGGVVVTDKPTEETLRRSLEAFFRDRQRQRRE